MKQIFLILTIGCISYSTIAQETAQSLFGFYIKAKMFSTSATDMKNFHISDHMSHGLRKDGSEYEGRAPVNLESIDISGMKPGIAIGTYFYATSKQYFNIEIEYATSSEFWLSGVGLSYSYTIIGNRETKYNLALTPSVSYIGSEIKAGELKILPQFNTPMGFNNSTYSNGDELGIKNNIISLGLNISQSYQINNSLRIMADVGYNFSSVFEKPQMRINNSKIKIDSEAFVKTDGTSTPADLKPRLDLTGISFKIGIAFIPAAYANKGKSKEKIK